MWWANRRRSEAGFLTLIELLVVLVIIFGLFWVFMKPGGIPGMPTTPTRPGGPTTTPGMAIEQAKNVECRTNLGQVRQAIMMFKMSNEEAAPSNLDELRLPTESTTCPVGKQPYTYDPQTGQVRCSTPGHDRY